MPERKKLLLRLDPQVYDAIVRWAADDLRSVNAQIEYAVRLALRSAGRAARPPRSAQPSDPPRGGTPSVPTARAEPDGAEPDGPG